MLQAILKHKQSLRIYSKNTFFLSNTKIEESCFQFLDKMFKDDKKKIVLSKSFRILPFYFNSQKLKSMTQSQDFVQYKKYISKRESRKNEVINRASQFQNILKLLEIKKKKEERYLECYINYLKRNESMAENDYLMGSFDVRHPENWFKGNKESAQRQFIYHHGPTNSGKTYNAINELKRLSQSDKKGIYMSPLRLLAWQTQQKLGKCNLVTGQQKDYQNSNLTSCTVEAKTEDNFQVAILDQIQMISDKERGWAWTSTVLGIKANRIHLCGDERALHLVEKLIKVSGGSLSEVKYNRLSKLHFVKKIFNWDDLKPGDCIIDFSVKKLYSNRNLINKAKGTSNHPNKTAIVYGRMPPKCRKIQAQKFNSGQLPYLVASDAIGMGLNLKIRRVIFASIHKTKGEENNVLLEDHQIRQIAGRAGRGMQRGYVQCMSGFAVQIIQKALKNVNITISQQLDDDIDNEYLKDETQQYNVQEMKIQDVTGIKQEEMKAMQKQQQNDISDIYSDYLRRQLKKDEVKLEKAGIFFPYKFMRRIQIKISQILGKKLLFSQILTLISALSLQNQKDYFISTFSKTLAVAKTVQKHNADLQTNFKFSKVPIPDIFPNLVKQLCFYAKKLKTNDKAYLPPYIKEQAKNNFENCTTLQHLVTLQGYYCGLEAYQHLWNHFELNFPQKSKAEMIKNQVCLKISQILNQATSQKESVQKKMDIKVQYKKKTKSQMLLNQ